MTTTAPQPVELDSPKRDSFSRRHIGPSDSDIAAMLELLGYGLALAVDSHTGASIEADSYYHFNPGRGLMPAARGAAGAVLGSSVLALSAEQLGEGRTLEDAKRLLQAALAHCLEGRELTTRTVARSIARRGSRS